jgi:hypothetical protein
LGIIQPQATFTADIMARVKDNLLMEGASGQLAGMLLKKYRYGTVISKMPDRSKVKLSVKQKKANKTFQEAVKYARAVKNDPEKSQAIKKRAARKGSSVYHFALSEYLKGNKL